MFIANLADSIQSLLFKILLWIDGLVYSFINWIYQIIMILAQSGDIFNGTKINELVSRVYIIVGVVVLFLVAYSLLKAMINPDEGLKGKSSPTKTISNVVISVVLIAFVPTIFDFAMSFQNAILNQNTLGKMILGVTHESETASENNNVIAQGGFTMAETVFKAFFSPNTDVVGPNGKNYCSGDEYIDANLDCEELTIGGQSYDVWWNARRSEQHFLGITAASEEVAKGEDGNITYRFLFSTVAGVFVVIVLLSYCVDIAVRLVKLVVYKIIAPLPILCRIVPGDQGQKIFSNWLKTTLSTYLELFIRLLILYFCVLIIDMVPDSLGNIFSTLGNNWGSVNPIILLLAQAFVILGIVFFMKQAPNLIKEITGLDGGKYNMFSGAKQMFGTLGALTTGAVRGFTNTEWDKDHKIKSGWNRFKNSLSGGVQSFASAAKKDYKTWGDVKSGAHSSVEDVINKQRQKQAEKDAKKRDLEVYRNDRKPQGEDEKDWVYKARTSKVATWGMKAAKDKVEALSDWAGVGYSSVEANRIKEFHGKVEKDFSGAESFKNSQTYKDAKSEADRLKGSYGNYRQLLDKEIQEAYRTLEIDATKATEEDKKHVESLAKEQFQLKYKIDFDEAKNEFNLAQGALAQVERTEIKKKSAIMADAMRNIQLDEAQSSDIKVDINEVLNRDPQKRDIMMKAYQKYNNLADEKVYKQLVADLSSEDTATYEIAHGLLDFYDNYKKVTSDMSANAAFAEKQRSSGAKPKKDGGAK